MNQTDTPETDEKLAAGLTIDEMMEQHVPASFARKLERERNEARRELAKFKDAEPYIESKRREFIETMDQKVASREAEGWA